MVNFNSYDKLGQSGLALMRTSLQTANASAEKLAGGNVGVMDIAQTSMDMSKAKVQMALGAFLVKTHNDLMDTALEILMPRNKPHNVFGIGLRHDRYY